MKKILFVALLAAFACSAQAADLKDVVHIYAGVNGAWFDGESTSFPNDFEAGGNAAMSLSPHLSAVGSVYHGFNNSYTRWSVGGRTTVTDVDNRNFSVGLGVQYHGSDSDLLSPNEWAPDASFGWIPSPAALPRISIVGLGGYGLTSHRAHAILGIRYNFPL